MFDERVYQAYARFVERYPTIATLAPPMTDFVVVGSYLPKSLIINDPATLDRWLAEAPQKREEMVRKKST